MISQLYPTVLHGGKAAGGLAICVRGRFVQVRGDGEGDGNGDERSRLQPRAAYQKPGEMPLSRRRHFASAASAVRTKARLGSAGAVISLRSAIRLASVHVRRGRERSWGAFEE